MAAPISASVIPDSEISRRAALISIPHCDTQPNQRQCASVFAGIYTPKYRSPMDMRSLLKALMALRDVNACGLESRSGVPQATINRFLTGKHGDPRPPTVRKLAGAGAGSVAGAAVGGSVAAVVAVALYRAQR